MQRDQYSIGQQSRAFVLWGDEGLQVETRTLICALIQPFMSTSRAFMDAVRLWSQLEMVIARFSSCIKRVYKCKLYNGSWINIFYWTTCFYFYQYLYQSASQFQCAKLNVCSMTELLVEIYGCSFSWHDPLRFLSLE